MCTSSHRVMDIARSMPHYNDLRNSLTMAEQDVGTSLDVVALTRSVREMEEEARKLEEMMVELGKQWNFRQTAAGSDAPYIPTPEERLESDARSIYVGNVDYATKAKELKWHFKQCGYITRVTLPCDRLTGERKGYAYIEFAGEYGFDMAMTFDGCWFRNRQIKVKPKRTNRRGIISTHRCHARGQAGEQVGRGRGFARQEETSDVSEAEQTTTVHSLSKMERASLYNMSYINYCLML